MRWRVTAAFVLAATVGVAGAVHAESPALPTAAPPQVVSSTVEEVADLEVTLRLDTASVGPRDRLLVRVDLVNRDTVPVTFLTSGTPFEGQPADVLSVRSAGRRIAYTDKLLKRAVPARSAYRTLAPGATATATVDVTASYDVHRAGRYRIALRTTLPDVRRGGGAPRTVDPSSFTPVVLRTGPVFASVLADRPQVSRTLPGGYTNCTPTEKADIETAVIGARQIVATAVAELADAAAPASASRYITWFGVHSPTRYATVSANFQAIDAALAVSATVGSPWACNVGCPLGAYAYVYPNDVSRTVYLCSYFFAAPDLGTDSKAGVLVHEISHFASVAGTDDFAYGQLDAAALAVSSPNDAVANADSHEYFAENTPAITMGNMRPRATPASVNAPTGVATAITLAGTDRDGTPLTYTIVSPPAHGRLTGTPPNVRYIPTIPFTATDSFTFAASDGSATSAPATVSIQTTGDTSAPSVVVTAPTANQKSAAPVTFSGTASDGVGVRAVVLRITDATGRQWNGSTWVTNATVNATLQTPNGTSTTWQYVFSPPETEGYRLTLRAWSRDAVGLVSPTVVRTFHTDVTPPTVTIWSPTQNSVGAVTEVSGSVLDGAALGSVRLFIRNAAGQYWTGSAWQTAGASVAATLTPIGDAAATWSYAFAPPPGRYRVLARGYDKLGNSATTSLRTFDAT